MKSPQTRRTPWLFLPTLYFGEGLPYVLVNTVSVILYKRMGIDNGAIAFWTSWLYLPWVIKMFWGPLVDIYSTKRRWALTMQAAMGLCVFLVSLSITSPHFFAMSLALFCIAAFVSATYDIATDGFYMLALTDAQQAMFVGVRSAFYRLAMVTGSGGLVYLAGTLEAVHGSISKGWSSAFSIAGLLFALLFLYHRFALPDPETTAARTDLHDSSMADAVRSYFGQERIGLMLLFILLYRLGEAMLLKLVAPFLLDRPEAGGLGLTTQQVGLVYGTIGVTCLVLGGILGGWLLSRFGLRRAVWPMVLAMHLPNLFFVYLAYHQPDVALVYPLVALEQFGYGLGFTVFTVYLMNSATGRYKTTHYAISTGIMALGMMLPSFASGWLQQAVGYRMFFIIVCCLTVPGMLTIPFIRKHA